MTENASLTNFVLKTAGIFSSEQISRIISARAENPGMSLCEAAIKFGGHREIEVLAGVGSALGLEIIDLEHNQPTAEALTKIPASAVYQYNVLPYRCDGQSMTIVASDPFDTTPVDS
jgi:hypothetical protein